MTPIARTHRPLTAPACGVTVDAGARRLRLPGPTLGLALGLAWCLPLAALARGIDEAAVREEAATACEEAAAMLRDDDIDGAIAEARWCVESLEQLERNRTLAAFPDRVEGWSGGALEQQGAMGMTILSRRYEDGDAGSIGVTLTTGAAGSGLAAIAQMGIAMGAGSNRKLRVQRRTVLDMSEPGGGVNYLVELRSGGMLTVESDDAAPERVLAFLEAFPIAAIDDALSE